MRIFLLSFIFIISACSQAPIKRVDKLSVLQGVTNTKEVEFSIVALKDKDLRFELRSAEGEVIAPDEVKVITRDFSPYAVHKIVFVRDPKHEYNLYAFQGTKLIDQRLVGHGQQNVDRLRLAVASCMNDYYGDHFKIWEVVARKNPEYLLLIGDNVYADKGPNDQPISIDPEKLWNRYADVRLTLPLFFQEKLIPIHALWDDHDYGMNDGNEDFKYKNESKEIFDTFYAQDLSEDDWLKGQGVGGLLSLGDYNLYFLDSRSFRSARPEGRHLGIDQTNWLVTKLKEEKTPSLIIEGDQFFGGYHQFESFEGNHPKDFESFTEQLRLTTTPLVFLSGDAHMSEIMQFPRAFFGMPSFEITSSPIHAKTYPDREQKNPWRVVAVTGKVNFTMINNVAEENHWFLDVESIGDNGEVYYRRELAVFIKDLQNNLNELRKRRSGKRHRRIRRARRRK